MPPSRPRRPSLWLDIQSGDGEAAPIERARLRRLALAALERDASLTVRFVGEAEGRELNRRYRGRDYATNVLTFPYDTPDRLEADIVICTPVVRAEARAQRKRFEDHLAHLLVHGALHAQGHEHEDEDEAQRMEAAEVAILRRFRIADPYRDPDR
ncbi:MAG: rRNA maturation RNase YbeY [Burkholderiaceae bacterium]|jgi:probable rRNA maturation factor|nr:rRNA maturation RNase YbeY [Burkholderiaceae bacterium]MEB2318803.1 rRNA maturation RNase YbeY [Pseudomonadota bacterium]